MASLLESTVDCIDIGRGGTGGSANQRFGKNSLYSLSSGDFNTAIGYESGFNTSTGIQSTFLGFRAGLQTNGDKSVFIGSCAGYSNTYGNFTVAVGKCAGYYRNDTSVALGCQSMGLGGGGVYIDSVAVGNVANRQSTRCATNVGDAAGFAGGVGATRSVNIGNCAGQFAYQNNNLTIGAYAGRFGNQTNTTQIGFYTYGGYNVNNAFILGRYSAANAYVYVAWTNISDSRDKVNVQTLPDNLGLNFLRKLRPVKFKYDTRTEYMFKCGFEYGVKDGTLKKNECNYGFLAQEIEQAAKDLNVKFDAVQYDKYNDKYSVKLLELLSPIVKSIQELNDELDIIENQIG